MNEAETRAEHIDPALAAAGWGQVDGSRVLREYNITAGRLQGAGKRARADIADRHRAGRLKQWLNYMRRVYPEAQQAFDELRLVHDAGHIERWLVLHTAPAQDLAPAL
jgi:hypothetical protein